MIELNTIQLAFNGTFGVFFAILVILVSILLISLATTWGIKGFYFLQGKIESRKNERYDPK